ncbi:hypothetical protein N7462_000237 [Penicillium macrosclerotiorum]|uniref:uncharacterized protein n=1 Tax=Penicillium macrosclerotiorum TaxID=303699 RepID=UPI0025486A27|nr:uncharacterized protein N7462_000237 [Penicillium macrosclerotiorum]KAJ5698232.1 hypothetical protein N7462_000237 [Penicillium macrosclerotiorum]
MASADARFQDLPPSYDAAQQASGSSFAAPPRGLDDRQEQGPVGDPPPYHNWQEAVPDTSVFPPPPIAGYYASGTGNASSDDAERAHDFCDKTPLWIPVHPSAAVYTSVQEHDLRPVRQAEFAGDLVIIAPGRWTGCTVDQNGDCLVLTHLPLYFATVDSPFVREKRKTIYFEVTLRALRAGPGADASGLAIGFVAQPYPAWRSPGWERGSLGVFSDDGCRFVNDSWGGRDFTTPFQAGETLGIGMTFTLPENPLALADALFEVRRSCTVDVFFTRNGHPAGGWGLHEEMDEESGSVTGLEGDFDLYGAVGLFGGVDFETCFDPAGWLWKPAE